MKRNPWLAAVIVAASLLMFYKEGFAQDDVGSSGGEILTSDPSESKTTPEQEAVKKETYLFGTAELPLNEFKPEHFIRIVNGQAIPIGDLVSTSGIVLSFKRQPTEEDYILLEETYGLKKERKLGTNLSYPWLTLFSFTQGDMALEHVMAYLNRSYGNDAKWNGLVARTLPVFLFSDGPRFLTGNIVIEWSPKVKEGYAEEMAHRLKLEVVPFDPNTHVMIASPTNGSGYNVFALSQVFGPQNGNAFVLSVEPQYAFLDIPLTVNARVEPEDGKGHGGDIVGSVFRYILDIHASPGTQLMANELHVTSDALKKWLPRGANEEKKEVPSQVFIIEGNEEFSTANAADGGTDITVTYRFRMLQSGEFTLAPPPVRYSFHDPQLKKASDEKVNGAPVLFRVSPTMPSDASMINDATGIIAFSPVNPYPKAAPWFRAATHSFTSGALILALAFLWIAASQLGKHEIKEPGKKERARRAWDSARIELLDLVEKEPRVFQETLAKRTKAVLGLLAAEDEQYFAAVANMTGAWPGPMSQDTLQALQVYFTDVSNAPFDPERMIGREEAERLVKEFDALIGKIEGEMQ